MVPSSASVFIVGGWARLTSSRQVRLLTTSTRTKSSSTGNSQQQPGRSGGAFIPPVGGDVRSWQIHSYGGIEELQLSSSRLPLIKSPTDVLVKVHAASVNPIDLAMTKGYGAETINVLRTVCNAAETSLSSSGIQGLLSRLPLPVVGAKKGQLIEFPLTLGRDFAGTVVDVGHGVREKKGLRIGDEVFGVVGVQRQGTHADYVVAAADMVCRKPRNLSFTEAASLPYVGLTAWAAIRVTGAFMSLTQKRFLILGGSGGVGTFAVQYLKSLGANVVTTCSSDAQGLMTSLGSDVVIDYRAPDANVHIEKYAPYDCVLDLTGPINTEKSVEQTAKFLKPITGQFITLSPPFLSNIDKFGLLGGAVKNIGDLLNSNIKTWTKRNVITKWAFFIPNGTALESFADLAEKDRIQPVIHHTFKFKELPLAFKMMEEGHLRGKLVIDMQ